MSFILSGTTLLLDTHVLLWSLLLPRRLRAETRRALEDPRNRVLVSAVSAWEIAIKQSLGKLVIPGPAEQWLPSAVEQTGFTWIAVDEVAALRVRTLPWHHRDPFDRFLIAQAGRDMTIVTHDEVFERYDVAILRA